MAHAVGVCYADAAVDTSSAANQGSHEMSKLNCATVIAMIVGGLTVTCPASASTRTDLALSPASVSTSNDAIAAESLRGLSITELVASNQQQQQQQQQRRFSSNADVMFTAPLAGFVV
jgi:hypothetical protein